MIYGTNRIASIGEVEVEVNESYFGAGSLFFVQECAQDELALFEMAIKSDIDEVLVKESAEELETLNENFAKNALERLRSIMKKFKEWLMSFIKSRIAGLTNFIVKDNAKFVKHARVQINKIKSGTGHTIKAKSLDSTAFSKVLEKVKNVGSFEKKSVADLEAEIEKVDGMKIEDFIKEEAELDYQVVSRHLAWLEKEPADKVKELRKAAKDAMSNADKIVREAEKAAKAEKDDDKKNELNEKVTQATKYRDYTHKVCNYFLTALKAAIKTARRVVTLFMGGPKNEAYEPELLEAMIESAEFELDEAVEQMVESEEADLDSIEIEDEE